MFQITAEAYEASVGFLKSAICTKVRRNFLYSFVILAFSGIMKFCIIYTIIVGQLFQSKTTH